MRRGVAWIAVSAAERTLVPGEITQRVVTARVSVKKNDPVREARGLARGRLDEWPPARTCLVAIRRDGSPNTAASSGRGVVTVSTPGRPAIRKHARVPRPANPRFGRIHARESVVEVLRLSTRMRLRVGPSGTARRSNSSASSGSALFCSLGWGQPLPTPVAAAPPWRRPARPWWLQDSRLARSCCWYVPFSDV